MRYYLDLLLVTPCFAQNPFEPDTNIGCVERLPAPAYSTAAIQAKAEGIIIATVTVAPKATVQLQIASEFRSKTQKGMGVLMQLVEKAVVDAAYRPSCAGKTVSLSFDFKLAGQPSECPRQTISFGYPNKFWIVSEPGK